MLKHIRLYPLAMAVTATALLIEGLAFEIALKPVCPVIPVFCIVISLLGFWFAAEECK